MTRYIFFIVLWLFGGILHASVEDYKQVHEASNRVFKQEMHIILEKELSNRKDNVGEIYKAIGYLPVWTQKDGLSSFGVYLLGEIKDDLTHGTLSALKEPYEKVIQLDNALGESPGNKQLLGLELAVMDLYVQHIDAILKESDTALSPKVLLIESLKRGTLVHSFNRLANARIQKRIPLLERQNDPEAIKLRKKLTEGNKDERMKALYALLEYRPIWIDEKGITDFTKTLYRTIENDPIFDHSGPTYRKFEKLRILPQPKSKKEIVKREFEIAGLYQDYMGYMLYGSIDWKKFQRKLKRTHKHGVWDVHDVLLSPELLLIKAVEKGNLTYAFEEAKPKFPVYDRMATALQKYRKIAQAGGWKQLPAFKDLKPGMRSEIVPFLRERLRIEGDYMLCEGVDANSTLYDDCLLRAVKHFQARHGLEAEGYIGKKTRKALSESAQHKYVRLRLNIARLKWLKRDSDRYHIVVNIPDFKIYVFDGWKMMEEMRVVTGRKGHETPVFYNRVKRIVLNPYWRIPASIIRHETIPKLQRNPGYANKAHIEIHTGYSEHSPRINPYKVNWHKYGKHLPPYKFMQSPGKRNALGKVKFLFPNQYSVYMHDTPEKALFARDIRAYSHGCIRLHRPVDMLKVFSQIDPQSVNYEKSLKILESNKNTPLRLSRSTPIDVIYLTAWADENGTAQFREDIYGYDALQIETAKWLPVAEQETTKSVDSHS